MDIDFKEIRGLNGDKRLGFEELCCQLFSLEPPAEGSVFQRKEGAGGDAGIESFWELPGGEEHGLQAKYFFDLKSNQWRQIDNSVKQALDKHPNLSVYIICLPIDLTDKRIKGQKSQRDQWEEHNDKWNTWCSDKDISVTFILWSRFHLIKKLTRAEDPHYAGRVLYWFKTHILTREWFQLNFNKSRANLGERFTPDFNVSLPIIEVFSYLAKSSSYKERLIELANLVFLESADLVKAIKTYEKSNVNDLQQNVFDSFDSQTFLTQTRNTYNAIIDSVSNVSECLKASETLNSLKTIIDYIGKLFSIVHNLPDDESKNDFDVVTKRSLQQSIDKAQTAQYDLSNFLRASHAATTKALLVTGAAGVGKSHLFADIAQRILNKRMPVVLLLGQHVVKGNPWDCFLSELELTNESLENFLGALDAAGQASGVRALILIDAINEGEGSNEWRDRLPGILETCNRFPHVAIGLSCRSIFERRLVQDSISQEKLVRIEHKGFMGREYDAAKIYLGKRGIDLPSAPILSPEFSNPLFLKTCSESLVRQNVNTFPKGLQGITSLLDFYLDSLEKALEFRHGVSSSERTIHKLIERLVGEMVQGKHPEIIEGEKARSLIMNFAEDRGIPPRLFYSFLLAEGLFAEDIRYRDAKDTYGEDILRFSYQRFSDHLICNDILKNIASETELIHSFSPEGKYGKQLIDGNWKYFFGLYSALAIQLPETFGKEIQDVINCEMLIFPPHDQFTESIIYRIPDSITDRTIELLNQFDDNLILSTMLKVGTIVGHPLNAAKLHDNLKNMEMPSRDSLWSVFLAKNYYSNEPGEDYSPITTYLDWSLTGDLSQLNIDQRLLCGLVLGWFFSTSYRRVRDLATKGLVRLFLGYESQMENLLKMFEHVDDLYVQERLYAVAYGVSLYSSGGDSLRNLANYIYGQVFSQNSRLADHILLRDFARGVIEVAIRMDSHPSDVDIIKVRRPYPGKWPIENPKQSEIEEKYSRNNEGFGDIYRSAGEWGDFGRYTMGVIHRFCETPLNLPMPRTGKEVIDDTFRKLERKYGEKFTYNKRAWLEAKQAFDNFANRRSKEIRELLSSIDNSQLDKVLSKANDINDLNIPNGSQQSSQDKYFFDNEDQKKIKQRLSELAEQKYGDMTDDLLEEDRDELRWALGLMPNYFASFSRKWAQRWLCKRAHEMGWTPSLFSDFERYHIRHYDRRPPRIERIGKKYQWLALYELLARMSDNLFYASSTRYQKEYCALTEPWDLGQRNIDPSWIVHPIDDDADPLTGTWWSPYFANLGDIDPEGLSNWTLSGDNLPDFRSMLSVLNPRTSEEWLVLQNYLNYSGRIENNRRAESHYPSINIWIKSFLVKNRDLNTILPYLRKNFDKAIQAIGVGGGTTSAFLGEFYWHPINNQEACEEWILPEKSSWSLPFPFIRTAILYYWEGGSYDFSIEENVSTSVPSPWIHSRFGLALTNPESPRFVGPENQTVFFDPSLSEHGMPAALIRKDIFSEFIKDNSLTLIWLTESEKLALGGPINGMGSDLGSFNQKGIYYLDDGKIIEETWEARRMPSSI